MSGPADLVLTGGVLYTADPEQPRAEAVAIRSGRIAAVGPRARIEGWVGPGTRVLDLAGTMVVPGFQDAHVHPLTGGLARLRCNLEGVIDAAGYESKIRAHAEAHPASSWILGRGWSLPHFPGGTPHRGLLDAMVPDRPVFLVNRDGHGAWVNSRALELAGVSRSTPDPPDGRIEREEDGTPSGVLHEGAMALVDRLVPRPTPGEVREALLDAQAYLHSVGITAWQDAWVEPDDLAAYRGVDADGLLTAHVVGALWWDRERGLEQIADLREMRDEALGRRFHAGTVKIMQDGIPENFTAAMLEPYLEPEGRRGLSFVEPDLLRRAVVSLDRDGFQVHLHAIGDRACREALDAVEAARAVNGPGDRRHNIAHLQVIHPDDVPRFGPLGVVANAQPYWACMDDQMRDLCVPILGPDRVRTQYPFASLVRSGARLAFGSDWPVTTPDPLKIIQVAVTRVPFEAPGREPFLPAERIGLAQALEAATRGAAFVNHLDEETGSIEAGKLADLAVIDRDPFAVDPTEIGRAKVVLTLVEGEPVYVALPDLAAVLED